MDEMKKALDALNQVQVSGEKNLFYLLTAMQNIEIAWGKYNKTEVKKDVKKDG